MSESVIGGLVYKISSDSSALKRDLADVKRIGETLNASLQSETNKGVTAAASLIAGFQSKTVAQLSSLKGKLDVDVTGLQKQAALLQEAIQHKEALAKVKAIGLDVTELEKAETLLQELSRVNRKTIEIDFQLPNTSTAFAGITDSFKGVFTGIAQGIGQQFALTFTNAVGNALGEVKNILTDRKAFNDFDAAKTSLKSLGADADELAGYAAKATKELQGLASTREILASSYQIVSSGFQGKDAIDIATIAKKTAVATPETSGKTADTGVVGDAMTTVLKSYRLGAEQATNVSQQMIGVVNAGKITMDQYASLIGNVSSNAYAAGISLNDLNSVIAASTQNGVKAEATMAGLNAAASAIAKPSHEALEYAKRIGLDFSLAGVKAAGGFVPFLQKLKDVGASDFGSITRLFGSVEAAKALNPVLSSLGDGFADIQKVVEGQDLTKQFEAASHSIARLQDKQKALREELDLKYQTAIAPIFEAGNFALTGVLAKLNEGGSLFSALNGASTKFSETLQANPEIITALTTGIEQLISTGLDILVSDIQSFTAALRENPSLVQELVSGFVGLVQNAVALTSGLISGFGDVFSVITPFVNLLGMLSGANGDATALAETVGRIAAYAVTIGVLTTTISSIAGAVTTITGLVAGLQTALAAATATGGVLAVGFAGIAPLILPIIAAVAAVATTVALIVVIVQNWEAITKSVGEAITGVYNNVKQAYDQSDLFKGIWEFIKNLIPGIPFVSMIASVADGVSKSQQFKGIWDGVTGIIGGVANAVKGALGGALDFVISRATQFLEQLKSAMGIGGGTNSNPVSNLTGGASDADKNVAAVLSILEAPSRQGRLDVSQVLANRVGTNFGGYGANVRDQAFAPGQFQPFFGQNGIKKNDIQDRESAIAALKKAGYSTDQAIDALAAFFRDVADGAKTADSAAKVGGRAYFKGVSEYGNMRPGDFLRNRGENFFHDEAGDTRNRKLSPISSIFGTGVGAGAPVSTGAYKIIDSNDNHEIHGYSDITRHHANSGQEAGRSYGIVGGKQEEIRGNLVKKDMVLEQNGSTNVNVPSPSSGYVRTLNDGYNTVQIYADQAMTQLVGQVLHMRDIAVKTGQQINAGQDLGKQGDTGSPGAVHAHVETTAANFPGYIAGLKSGKFGGTAQASGVILGANVQTNPLLTSGGSDDKALSMALLAARKGQDDQIKLQRDQALKMQAQQQEEQKLSLQKQIASSSSPDMKRLLETKLKETTVGGQFDSKIQELGFQRTDLVKARDRKSADLTSSDSKLKQAAQDAPDYTAAIKNVDALIAGQEKLKAAALGVDAAAKQTAESTRALATSREARDQKALSAYETEKSHLEMLKSQATLTDQATAQSFAGQIKRLDLNYKESAELTKLNDQFADLTKARNEYAKALGDGKSDATLVNFNQQLSILQDKIATLKTTSADGLKLISAEDLKNAEEYRLKLDGIEQNKFKLQGDLALSVVKGQAGLLKGRGQDVEATALENQAAKAQEQLRYKQQLLDIDKQIAEASKNGIPFTSDQVAKLKADAGELNQINLSGIDQQFKSLGQTIADNVGKSFGDALTSIIDGTKSVAEAFTGMLKNIASQLIQQGINRLVGSLFGGLFGGGGGGILSGLFGGGGGMSGGIASSFGGGGLLSGVFGFAEGGIVGNSTSGYSPKAIQQALKKEGPRSQLIAATPGELILSVPQTRAFFSMGMDRKVLTMSAGGIVPGAASPSSASGSSGNGVNLSQHFTISNDSNTQNNQKFAEKAKEVMLNLILSQKRPGGLLAT